MDNFTPGLGLLGGVIIGIAATVLLWFNGRIAGISGIFNGMITIRRKGDVLWRFLFILGMIAGGLAHQFLILDKPFYQPTGLPLPLLVIGGLLVGYGTSMGSGCASGHGVCGLGRTSVRSMYAVVTFLTTAIVTTYVMRHLLGVM